MIDHKSDRIYPSPRLKQSSNMNWSTLFGIHLNLFIISIVIIIFSATIHTTAAQYETDFQVKPETFHGNEQNCAGEWKYPSNCSTFNCDYKATWEYRDENDEIIFTISTRNRNKWTGIAFSDNQAMPDTDAILGLVEESGRFFLMDSYLPQYEAPPLDTMQNLFNMSAWRENGLTTLRFSRPRQTGDPRDYQFTDTNCPYFIFPVMGGVFNAVNKRIRKHESTPIISDRRICVRSCRIPALPTTTTTTTTTTSTTTHTPTTYHIDQSDSIISLNDGDSEKTKVYQAELKFYNLFSPGNKPATKEMLKMVENNLYQELKPYYNRIRRIEVNDLKNDPNNNIAIIDLIVAQSDKDEKEEIRSLTTALNAVIKDNRIGKWNVDSNHLVVTEKENNSNGWLNFLYASFNRFNEEEQKWIIIGAGLTALVLLALIQLLCMFCGCKCGNRRSHEDYVNEKDDKQWANEPYSTMYNGYPVDDYGYQAKLNSLHKNYRNSAEHGVVDPRSLHYTNGQQSLDRRQYQDQHGNIRIRPSNGYEMNERHHNHNHNHNHHHRGGGGGGHQASHMQHHLQPDFYFMPHQRKYSSDVVRVYVDYDGN